MMSALAECYCAADSWETRRQILFIMVDKLALNQLRQWIPDSSQYRFTEARRICLVYGRGAQVLTVATPRMRVSTAQIDHFIAFITSPHIIQDLEVWVGKNHPLSGLKDRTLVMLRVLGRTENYISFLGFYIKVAFLIFSEQKQTNQEL